jgi:hypothetical protein
MPCVNLRPIFHVVLLVTELAKIVDRYIHDGVRRGRSSYTV